MLRAEIKKGTELGKTAKGYIDQGQLLPDELIIDILASTLDSFKESKGVIFDGFPRTIAQAEALKKMLAERGQEVSVMLDLDVPEEELMTRLIKRGQESGRADDNEETIKKRLVVQISFHYGVNIPIVTSQAIIIQTIPHNKIIGNTHGHIMYIQFHLQFIRFQQQGSDTDLFRFSSL